MPVSIEPPLPFDGHIYFGCRTWEPRYDLDYGRQDPEGRWRIGRARKRSRCICGGKDGYVRRGHRLYCAGCNAYSQDHRLPDVPPIQSYTPPPAPEAKPGEPERKLTRREKRRLKFGPCAAITDRADPDGPVTAPKGTIDYDNSAVGADHTRRLRARRKVAK
jgi:hypothetical protein